MEQENIPSNNFQPSQDDVQKETEILISPTTTTSASSSSNLTVPKTARNKFFKDLQCETEKKRWSAECVLCTKSKRIFDKLGVTSNFTRHARECHKPAFDIWERELKELKSVSPTKSMNKITNHFPKRSPSSHHSTYNANHPPQIELSMGVVNDLIIKLGLPLSIVERSAFINFMKTVDPKFSLTSRRTLSRTTIPSLYEKMNNQLKMFCSKPHSYLWLWMFGVIDGCDLFSL
jgi:hypothetical protein